MAEDPDDNGATPQELEKLKLWLGFAKFLVGTVALGLLTAYINYQIQARQLDLAQRKEEIASLGNYIKYALDKDIDQRIKFAHYFATLTISDDISARWRRYLGDLQNEASVELQSRVRQASAQGATPTANTKLESLLAQVQKIPIKILPSRDFAELAGEYLRLYDLAVVIRPAQAKAFAERIVANRARYETVSAATGVPWHVVGILHGLESSFNFSRHLHNGDPLTARTIHSPAGRPVSGNPPFTWEQSAIDALQASGLAKETDWSPAHQLYLFERYNGFGYRMRGIASPYLWSCTQLYQSGGFVNERTFDPNLVKDQCGVAAILKTLEQEHAIAALRTQ
jgi:lysozyme family protein